MCGKRLSFVPIDLPPSNDRVTVTFSKLWRYRGLGSTLTSFISRLAPRVCWITHNTQEPSTKANQNIQLQVIIGFKSTKRKCHIVSLINKRPRLHPRSKFAPLCDQNIQRTSSCGLPRIKIGSDIQYTKSVHKILRAEKFVKKGRKGKWLIFELLQRSLLSCS